MPTNIKIHTGGTTPLLEKIDSISIDASFKQSLNDAFGSVNRNFQKVLSLPFLKGDPGNDIVEQTIRFDQSAPNNTVSRKLFEAVCKAIYGPNATAPNDSSKGGAINSVNSWKQWISDPESRDVSFYIHRQTDESGDKYLYVSRELYMFTDSRVNELSDLLPVSVLTSFEDLSCAMIITCSAPSDPQTGLPKEDEAVFTAKVFNVVPTLYYDNNSKYWCWKINGTRTGVIAQGVKGDDGASINVYICYGYKTDVNNSTGHFNVRITDILSPVTQQAHLEGYTYPAIPANSLVGVWFNTQGGSGGTTASVFDDFTFGLSENLYMPNSDGEMEYQYTYVRVFGTQNQDSTLNNIVAHLGLYERMIKITDSDGESTISPRGLFVPNDVPAANGTHGLHMFWSERKPDTEPVAHLGYVGFANGQTENANNLPYINDADYTTADNARLGIWYGALRHYKFSLSKKISNSTGVISQNSPTNILFTSYDMFSGYSSYPRSTSVLYSHARFGESNSTEGSVNISTGGISIAKAEGESLGVPSLYVNMKDDTGAVYFNKGSFTINAGKQYIGNPATHLSFDEDYLDGKIKQYRFQRMNLINPGLKLFQSDEIIQNGSLVVSSLDQQSYIVAHDNSLQFRRSLDDIIESPSAQDYTLTEARPRELPYLGVKLGGYATIYNTLTTNATDTGKVDHCLDDIGHPMTLSEEENRKYGFMSGKMGYTAVLENWSSAEFEVQKPFRLDGNSNMTKYPSSDAKMGIITSYDAIWTKIGNVVDVKGKIFFTTAKYTKTNGQFSVDMSTDCPISYAQFFKYMRDNNSHIAFPLPVVIGFESNGSMKYRASTGNSLGNPLNSNIVSFHNLKKTNWGGNASGDYPSPWPTNTSGFSLDPNKIYNGSAEFHFYGTDIGDDTLENSQLNGNHFEMNNNVFSITSSITKSLNNYGDRYWTLGSLPNYDVLNCKGSIPSEIVDDVNRPREDAVLANDACGPVKIVCSEDSSFKKTQTTRYKQLSSILGFRMKMNGDLSNDTNSNHFSNRHPSRYTGQAAVTQDWGDGGIAGVGPSQAPISLITQYNLAQSVQNNIYKNQGAYKLSVNIGGYLIRYISFGFSYVLDDDIQTRYLSNDLQSNVQSADSNDYSFYHNGTSGGLGGQWYQRAFTSSEWHTRAVDTQTQRPYAHAGSRVDPNETTTDSTERTGGSDDHAVFTT